MGGNHKKESLTSSALKHSSKCNKYPPFGLNKYPINIYYGLYRVLCRTIRGVWFFASIKEQ